MKAKKFLYFCAIIPLLIATSLGSNYSNKVARVIDGDTIVLENGEKVRYIGMDTPETKHPSKPVEYYGKEATEANRKLVENKTVRLEFDAQERDKYGRLLAYVFVDTIFVNGWLVKEGYAKVSTYPPNVKYQDLLLILERKAREEGRGLWAKETSSKGTNASNPPKKVSDSSRHRASLFGCQGRPGCQRQPKKVNVSPRYCASRKSNVFHHCWCHYVDRIASHNFITVHTREKAIQSGRRPCKKCKP